jgi:hypothetical protein
VIALPDVAVHFPVVTLTPTRLAGPLPPPLVAVHPPQNTRTSEEQQTIRLRRPSSPMARSFLQSDGVAPAAAGVARVARLRARQGLQRRHIQRTLPRMRVPFAGPALHPHSAHRVPQGDVCVWMCVVCHTVAGCCVATTRTAVPVCMLCVHDDRAVMCGCRRVAWRGICSVGGLSDAWTTALYMLSRRADDAAAAAPGLLRRRAWIAGPRRAAGDSGA